MYKKEIFKLKEQGLNNREIERRFSFSLKQIEQFLKREIRTDKKTRTGIALEKKGRPPKEYDNSIVAYKARTIQ